MKLYRATVRLPRSADGVPGPAPGGYVWAEEDDVWPLVQAGYLVEVKPPKQ